MEQYAIIMPLWFVRIMEYLMSMLWKCLICYDQSNNDVVIWKWKPRRAKSNKGCRGNKKKERESEQLNVDPEQIIEEEEKRQPHSVEDE